MGEKDDAQKDGPANTTPSSTEAPLNASKRAVRRPSEAVKLKVRPKRAPAAKRAAPAAAEAEAEALPGAGQPVAGRRGLKDYKVRRVLALDGAGVYGLVCANWLRQLWEKESSFLAPGGNQEVALFAGISSGAVNALLLAKYDDPRKALEAGELEAFWKEEKGVFSNTDPMSSWLSMLGLTPTFGTQEFLAQLKAHFGDMTLGELKHNVLIGTFNFHGGSGRIDFGDERGEPWFAPQRAAPSGGDREKGWRPKFFTNIHRDDPDNDYRVVDVAFAAAAPPPLRAVRGGIGDAAVFTANPSVEAIAAVLDELDPERESKLQAREAFRRLSPEARAAAQAVSADGKARARGPGMGPAGLDMVEPLFRSVIAKANMAHVKDGLPSIRVLSVGDGVMEANYWLRDFALGPLPFMMLPTNPLAGQYYPPSMGLCLDAPRHAAHYVTQKLLGGHYRRLDPPLMQMPTMIATMMAKTPAFHQWIVKQIEHETKADASRQAISETVDFLRRNWNDPLPQED